MDPFTPATELADAVRRREVSPVELAELYLGRIDKLDPELNAFCFRDDDRVLGWAREAEAAVTGGAGDLPPFHGVPLPVKDLNRVEGWPTTYGSRGASTAPNTSTDLVVQRFIDAGFIPLGMTNSPEFGTVSFTESEAHGVTRNPWDPERTPGGSSGGAGAAVASGMAPIAHASDGGGS
ncbi:MAG TPA: amidase, partial [Acidimicrobiales bacterium]|nr:amidase [Acidimicrobiales bacterium]